MADFLIIAAMVIMLSLLLGLVRVLMGPGTANRMMATLLIGTSGVGLLLVLSLILEQPALMDVALILALLAAVSTAAFTGTPGASRDD